MGYTGAQCETHYDPCAGLICKNGGSCVTNGGIATCQCPSGFYGDHCEFTMNSCVNSDHSPVNCGHGTCRPVVIKDISDKQPQTYDCVCYAGYTGTTCDVKIDYCSPSPCKNGATCWNVLGAAQCECLIGFTGEFCETEIKTTTTTTATTTTSTKTAKTTTTARITTASTIAKTTSLSTGGLLKNNWFLKY